MSSDTGFKLFGKTIAKPFCSEEGGEDYNKCSPMDNEQQSVSLWNAEENRNNDGQEKPKIPGKILGCPRCKSMHTKFCYYNNNNINQPRHFCENCRRYWTGGDTLRYVPVSAGHSKSENSSTSHLIISDTALDVGKISLT